MLLSTEISSQDCLKLLSVLLLHLLHVLFEGLIFIGFVDVDSVVDKLFKFLIKVVTIFLLFVIFLIDGLDFVVIFFVVWTEFGLLLKEFFGAFELLLSFFLFLLNDNSDFPEFSELFKF